MRPSLTLAAVIVLVALVPTSTAGAQTAPAPARPKPAAPAGPALPAAIDAAFRKAYPSAVVKGVSREKQGSVTVYEVESTDAGMTRDLIYHVDGTVVEMEEELGAADVPPAVTSALAARYSKATVIKREKLTKGTTVSYEIQLKGAGVAEAVLSPEGAWISPKAPVTKPRATPK